MFHALIWPAMLMAEGTYQLPAYVVANSFLNIKFPGKDEEKISKSRGTAIWIESYLETLEPDPLRYYLTAVAPESRRTAFDVDGFLARNNGELVNALGNFVNRALTFNGRYFDGLVPGIGEREGVDLEKMNRLRACSARVTELLEAQALGFERRRVAGEEAEGAQHLLAGLAELDEVVRQRLRVGPLFRAKTAEAAAGEGRAEGAAARMGRRAEAGRAMGDHHADIAF